MTSVTTGGTPVTTTYDAANRPTSTGFGSDADGRLTARPTAGGQSFTWDDLGRLTAVKNAAGTVTLATYTYDPLDRLRLVDHPAVGGSGNLAWRRSRCGVLRRRPYLGSDRIAVLRQRACTCLYI